MPQKVYTNADLTPQPSADLKGLVYDPSVRGWVTPWEVTPKFEDAPVDPDAPRFDKYGNYLGERQTDLAKKALAGIEGSDLGRELSSIDRGQAIDRYQREQDAIERNVRGEQVGAVGRGLGAGATAAAMAYGVPALAAAAPAAVQPIISFLGRPSVMGAMGAYEGYKHGGILGALEGGALGYGGGKIGGRLLRALEGIGGVVPEAEAAAAASRAAGEASASKLTATKPYEDVAERVMSRGVGAPDVVRVPAPGTGAYEVADTYDALINKGYSDAAARKIAGMADRSMVYNPSKASAFPSNVKFPGKSVNDVLERAGAGPMRSTMARRTANDAFDSLGDRAQHSLDDLAASSPNIRSVGETQFRPAARAVADPNTGHEFQAVTDPNFNQGVGDPELAGSVSYSPEPVDPAELLRRDAARRYLNNHRQPNEQALIDLILKRNAQLPR